MKTAFRYIFLASAYSTVCFLLLCAGFIGHRAVVAYLTQEPVLPISWKDAEYLEASRGGSLFVGICISLAQAARKIARVFIP